MALITRPSQLSINLLAGAAAYVSQRDAWAFETDYQHQHQVKSQPRQDITEQEPSTKLQVEGNSDVKKDSSAKSPANFLQELYSRNGVYTAELRRNAGRPPKPSEEAIDAYDMEITRAVRNGNLKKVKALHRNGGASLDACNRFGESLLHIACRRGNAAMVEYMLFEADVNPRVCDDMGRTAFHDICWSTQPNCDTMDVLLKALSPDELLKKDARGHIPFDYTPTRHWGAWIKYLQKREDFILNWIQTKKDSMGSSEEDRVN